MSKDEIEASRAPLIEHLAELRRRLIWCVLALVGASIVAFVFNEELTNLLARPLLEANPQAKLQTLSPQEAFFASINLSLWGGFFLSFPVIAAQVWGFVAPGLYNNEKAAFGPFLLASPVLFALGASLAYFVVIPLALDFLVNFANRSSAQGWVAVENVNSVSAYQGFIKAMLFAFGVCFQLPVVLTLLGKIGVISSSWLAQGRRYAVVIIFIVAMILTPPDPMSQTILAVPVYLLYEISIHIVRIFERRRAEEDAAEAKAEAAEGAE